VSLLSLVVNGLLVLNIIDNEDGQIAEST